MIKKTIPFHSAFRSMIIVLLGIMLNVSLCFSQLSYFDSNVLMREDAGLIKGNYPSLDDFRFPLNRSSLLAFDSIHQRRNELVLPKKRRRLNLNIKSQITPIVGYKFGSDLVLNGDSAYVHSIEFGAALIYGNINEWSSWGPLPLGWDWSYYTVPYVTLEYRWLRRFYETTEIVNEKVKFNPVMLNLGVSGGIGGVFIFIPVPFSINGMAGLSTDFHQLYARARIGYDIMGFSIGAGIYYSLTKRKTAFNVPHYSFFEISYTFIRNN